jgi:hypothetical protein
MDSPKNREKISWKTEGLGIPKKVRLLTSKTSTQHKKGDEVEQEELKKTIKPSEETAKRVSLTPDRSMVI